MCTSGWEPFSPLIPLHSLKLRLRAHFMSRGCFEPPAPTVLQEALQLTLQPAADTVSSIMVPHPHKAAEQLLSQHRFWITEGFYFAHIKNRSSINHSGVGSLALLLKSQRNVRDYGMRSFRFIKPCAAGWTMSSHFLLEIVNCTYR